jgi:alkylation response protein AidB-like acyl-CoA dehydrogenase
MDFALTEEQQRFQKLFRDFATKEVAKTADQTDKKEEHPAKLIKRAASQGFLGVLAPEEPYGGAGLDFTSYTLLIEAMAAECASTALILHIHNLLVLRTIIQHGSAAVQEAVVPEMISGDRIGAFALTEGGAGSDPTQLRTVACNDGDSYVISGHKAWVSNGGIAGVFIVFAATDPTAGARGLSAFVVPAEAEGVTIGGREKTLGLRGVTINRVYLRDVRVPADHLLGGEGSGYKVALETLNYGRVGISAAAVGLSRRVLELATKYSTERKQFGTAIANKQAIQMYLADAATEVEAGLWLVRHAAWMADRGLPFSQEAAIAKLFCARMAGEVTNKMVQVHGGAGFSADYPIERYYRDARAIELLEGTSQMQQIVIAGGLLGPVGVKVRP